MHVRLFPDGWSYFWSAALKAAPDQLTPDSPETKLSGAMLAAENGLSGEPALARQIATDVAYLATVVQMVKQDHGEPGTDLSGIATPRRGEVPVEISWGERVQAGQGLVSHRFRIPL